MDDYLDLINEAKELTKTADKVTVREYIVCTSSSFIRLKEYFESYQEKKGEIEIYKPTPLDTEFAIYKVLIEGDKFNLVINTPVYDL